MTVYAKTNHMSAKIDFSVFRSAMAGSTFERNFEPIALTAPELWLLFLSVLHDFEICRTTIFVCDDSIENFFCKLSVSRRH